MANKKISQMTSVSALTGAEVIPVLQGGANRRTTVGTIVPPGGTTGQFLAKTSNNPYESEWTASPSGTIDIVGLPSAGALTGAEEIPVYQSPVNRKATLADVLPADGVAGQVPLKLSGTPYDMAWATIIPTGGSTGQVPVKLSGANYNFGWVTPFLPADLTQAAVGNVLYPTSPAETFAGITPTNKAYRWGDAFRYGVDPTGVTDSTAAIQTWVNASWAMYHYLDGQGIWNGGGGAYPVLQLPPGKFKISDTIYLPTGIVFMGTGHPSHTTGHTRIIMNSTAYSPPNGAGDNRNKPMIKFKRSDTPAGGGTLINSGMTSTIAQLEFWHVTQGNDFNNPLGGAGLGFNSYPLGATLAFDVDAADFRVVRCCFQHSPAAFWAKDVGTATVMRPDGFNGNRGIGIFFEECEFDAMPAHVYIRNCYLDLTFKNCQFFNGMHRYEGCTGKVVYQGGRWHGNSYVDAATVANTFSTFILEGADIENCSVAPNVTLSKATVVSITNNAMTKASGFSGVEVTDADGGMISGNTIDDSGFNAGAGTGIADYVAAIKMLGCRQVAVQGNNLTATDAASYNGFGILSGDSGRAGQNNVFQGNSVLAPYSGASFNGQNRYINVAAGDIRGMNYDAQAKSAIAGFGAKYLEITYSAAMTIDASVANNFRITATNNTAFSIALPTNGSQGQQITVTIRNTSGGALGVATWTSYKMAAWTQPSNGASRSITFNFDGTLWTEVTRTGADIPN